MSDSKWAIGTRVKWSMPKGPKVSGVIIFDEAMLAAAFIGRVLVAVDPDPGHPLGSKPPRLVVLCDASTLELA